MYEKSFDDIVDIAERAIMDLPDVEVLITTNNKGYKYIEIIAYPDIPVLDIAKEVKNPFASNKVIRAKTIDPDVIKDKVRKFLESPEYYVLKREKEIG